MFARLSGNPGRMTVKDQRAEMFGLADAFITLVDAPADEFDILDFLDVATERCVKVLGVTAAALLLVGHSGTLDFVGASTEQARLLGLFQQRNREGPCLDCYHSGQLVRCLDLAAAPARWPRFAPAAVEAGFAAVHALPMRFRDEVIGGLNLFTAWPGTLDEYTAGLAKALADVATIGILHKRTLRHHERVAEQLQATLDSRVLVEQAKGMLATRLRITMADAFTLLCDHARATDQHVVDLAATVVDGTADTAALTRTAAGLL